MKQYIGTKIIKAKPGTMAEAQALKGGMPIDQAKRMFRNSGTVDKEGYVVEYEDGYVSWSPAEAFEKAYRQCDSMTFGLAIEALKKGCKVARKGWNGKSQYIELASNISYVNALEEIVNCEHEAIGNKAIAFVGTSGVQMGWLASQADMLAEDWILVKEET